MDFDLFLRKWNYSISERKEMKNDQDSIVEGFTRLIEVSFFQFDVVFQISRIVINHFF